MGWRTHRAISGSASSIGAFPIDPHADDGRLMGAMDEDIVRDLRGRQFEWEVREASDRATSNRLLTTTEKDQGDATGTLVPAAVAKLVSRLGSANAAEAVLRIGKKLRRFGANDLHEMVLNPVEEAVHDLF